ncbi:sporulation protein YabP [Tumebacillus lipolyticus]|uniref:Sporulation protein YabP n=1 Tax=Tumebacillus lipolyticus TaxID=1280370 RepID=A0ABW4ZZ50_9BACL
MQEERLRNKNYPQHEVILRNRQNLELTGVLNVESFDAQEFVLKTQYGFLAIRGENLHIKTLNLENGIVAIEGLILDMGYFDEGMSAGEKAKGLFSKLFR